MNCFGLGFVLYKDNHVIIQIVLIHHLISVDDVQTAQRRCKTHSTEVIYLLLFSRLSPINYRINTCRVKFNDIGKILPIVRGFIIVYCSVRYMESGFVICFFGEDSCIQFSWFRSITVYIVKRFTFKVFVYRFISVICELNGRKVAITI